MRVMLKVNMPVHKANDLARQGELGSTIRKILDELQPEAAYFTADQGQRTGYLFMDIPDSTHIPRISEPWFLALEAALEIQPAMNPQDLAKAATHIEAAAKKYL